ncbi:hypothetical protein ON010_g18683 [Phytophthora cinnamomi]|nr:hypothetical protein ON010_g18683 [Phytophthora cinnamomi]
MATGSEYPDAVIDNLTRIIELSRRLRAHECSATDSPTDLAVNNASELARAERHALVGTDHQGFWTVAGRESRLTARFFTCRPPFVN